MSGFLPRGPVLPGLDPGSFVPCPFLSGPARHWAETSCYADLWIELLHAQGLEPRAMLGFAAEQDFEGDQFTFCKPRFTDLEALYGLSVQELAIYDRLEAHAAEQVARGRIVLVEVDAWWLPDTAGTTYRRGHSKTTIAINAIDTASCHLSYFHNRGYCALDGEDYAQIFARVPQPPELLFPYAEFVKPVAPPLRGAALRGEAARLLRRRLAARPERNPVAAWREAWPDHRETLMARPLDYFHLYAFNAPRQLGAGFELLGTHLRWLAPRGGLEPAAAACDEIAAGCKALQFQVARGVSRRRPPDLTESFARLEAAYAHVMEALCARDLASDEAEAA